MREAPRRPTPRRRRAAHDRGRGTIAPEIDLGGLIELGRRQGALTTDDLGRALPIDRMSAAEIADVIARLEAAGIAVEIDPVLLGPNRHDGVRLDPPPVAALDPPGAGAVRGPTPTASPLPVIVAPSASPPPAPVTRSRTALTIVVTAVIAAAAILAWLVWRPG